ncbi:hypothetical protein EG347_16410 [Chryseobacterium sp. G0186]|uniref:RHS repeat-associated core domain-containing protein n=1 Tax=Chryseobacterium sp. G0186 TaxID=2487064 RepID=UPI000F4F75F9|nr:RHS repeat-associated core domain-containing protein [Chryseobacterium sp. G0186]AZA78983.1 hypothetical protein EG347_16410 [Chryseobacterium sp. G0186]
MKFISSLILSLCSVIVFSQTILYQAETTSRTVQDPHTIVLAQGFKAQSGTSNSFVAKIGPSTDNPGGGPTDSQAGTNNPVGTTTPEGQSFHDTKGNIEVGGGGQLQFTLPIALPPGVKSVAPQVSLTYVSGSGNGIAGYGWSLSGITTISRVGKNIEKDGELKGIQLDYSDYYSFNGQRLTLKSGEYGKDGAEYVTEKYSNVKIKSVGTYNGSGPNIGPAHFEITFEDGSQALYGAYIPNGKNSQIATTPLEYNITKWKDAQGNYISYKYESSSSPGGFRPINLILRISSIEWGGNEILNKPHFNSINFLYGNRDLTELSYVQGTEYVQDKILSEIKVTANLNPFKTYRITYTKDDNGTNYQLLSDITEYNSAGEKANPVSFEYEKSTKATNWSQSRIGSIENSLVGDFDGDGKIDALEYKDQPSQVCESYDANGQCTNYVNKPAGLFLTKKTFDQPTGTYTYVGAIDISKEDFKKAIAISFKNNQSEIIENKQGFVLYKIAPTTKDLQLSLYSINEANQLEHKYTKTIPNNMYDITSPNWSPTKEGVTFKTTPLKLMEMDFDGDGISEILMGFNDAEHTKIKIPQNPNLPLSPPEFIETYQDTKRYIIFNLDNTIPPTESSSQASFYPYDTEITELYKIGDFDGDGKNDFLRFDSENRPILVQFKKSVNNSYFISETVFYLNDKRIKGITNGTVIGDFNGDGKSDLLVPAAETTTDWYLYQSTGKWFEEEFKPNFALYRKNPSVETNNDGTAKLERTSHQAYDLDKDGKSDFATFNYRKERVKFPNSTNNFEIKYYNNVDIKISTGNKGFSNDIHYAFNDTFPDNSPKGETSFNKRTGFDYQELVGNLKINQSIHQIILVAPGAGIYLFSDRIKKINLYDVSKEALIKSITQGGVKTTIDYKDLDINTDPNFYGSAKKEKYPYIEFDKFPQGLVVSQVQQENKKQDFRYRGLTAHLQGQGMLGFRQMARSSWYADGFENTKIWSGTEINPLNSGVPVKEWSIRTNNENLIFPTDISENNTQLLSFKSIQYQTDKLLNGQLITFVNNSDKPNVVTAILPKSTKTKDFLTGTTIESNVTYGAYYLPSQSVSNINNGYGMTTSTFEYIHNPSGDGTDYYIGRPKSKTDVVQAYGDTKSSKEEYLYENNLLKNQKNWNRDNTGWLQVTYHYDGFGNSTQKETTNSIDPQIQTVKTTYDPKGIFVIKKTDNLGLDTHIEYDDWGQIKKLTDPLGNIQENIYDNWGKLSKSKTNLEGTTTYQYEKDNNSNRTATGYEPDGNIAKKYTNRLGQEYKTSTKAFGQGQYISKETQYDILGRKIKESEPYFEGQSANQWNTIAYDDSVFPAKITVNAFNGKQMETSVSGLATTMKELNGYGRTTIKTTDALGNTVSTTDKGGIIQFSYNAAGEQIKAQYTENIVTTQYDVWGRKSEFNDPSNGVYKYEYDAFGQPKKTISPKGTKEYTYNNFGQLISQKELSTADGGQTTNKMIAFAYDDKGRLVSKSGTSKGNSYTSNVAYDPQGRVLSSSESGNGKYFVQKGITYDDKARVVSYEKQLYSSGVLTKVQIENVYSAWNGELYQIKDKNSGKILWQLNETNAKGQVLATKLGAVDINNTYDSNGFLTSINHSSAIKPSILQLSYSFDAIKNELKSRTTGGDFNITESFDYDDNNRLVNWTHPVTGVKPSMNRNVYDIKGRILENDQLGKIKFDNPAKIYQATGMTLNATGEQHYKNDLIQSISYNENNDPVFIDGEKGDVAFQYGLTAMRQKVSYGGNFGNDKEGKLTKYYSEDGSFEIIKNNTTGNEKHILYIDRTPYDSNIVYLKDHNESSGSYKFLHKDYIGSILAISDEAGNKLEQRHFDAWGNFTHLKIGNGPVETNADKIKDIVNTGGLLLERGYTSHEHFMEVGIIHMNGRLYDPLLRRFLNADENIQDPTNTQNYNKYGYVMNNPLMFNDPSGEFVFAAGFFLTWIAPVIWGAIVGTAISVGMYAIQAVINNNWSWRDFSRSVVLGAVTGAVSGGLGQIFSACGFWSTAGNGALVGAGTGGVTALINGQNFLEGVFKGAVIGGGVAAVSYTVNYYATGSYKTKYLSKDQISNIDDFKYDPNISSETMQSNINEMRGPSNFTKEEMLRFRIESDKLGVGDLQGYLNPGNGQQLAYTTHSFFKGYSNIVYSPIVAQNKSLLAFTMVHETGHAYGNALGLIDSSIDRQKYNITYNTLDTTQHFAISQLEHVYAKYNLINTIKNPKLFTDYLEVTNLQYYGLPSNLRSLIADTYNKLLPVFQRFMYYKR